MSVPPPRPLTAAALVVTCWVVVTGVLLALGWLVTHPAAGAVNGFDDPVNRWLVDQRTPVLDRFAEVGTFLGETPVGAGFAVLVGLGFSLWQRSVRPLLLVVVIEVCLGTLYRVVTTLEPRERPPVRILDTGLAPDHSFPSGHVATATVAYGVAVLLTAVYARAALRWVLPLLLLPALVLLSRLYQGAHHVTDVTTSVCYSVVLLLVLSRLLLPRPDRAREPTRA